MKRLTPLLQFSTISIQNLSHQLISPHIDGVISYQAHTLLEAPANRQLLVQIAQLIWVEAHDE